MDLAYGPEYAAFRAGVAAFLARAWPPDRRGAPVDAASRRRFLDAAVAEGLLYRGIPRRWGGSEQPFDPFREAIVAELFDAARAPWRLGPQGVGMIVPTLLELGQDWQRERFIRPTLRGDLVWCQGYSEPGAGSDLAGLQTRAEDKGDHYLVNGQKIWTSYANYADWIFCLVRTDANAPKHDGISFLLFDMESPGVSVSPIKLISGSSPFCQTFFQDVRVPKKNLVGKVNGGWTIAKKILQHEREMIGGMGFGLAESCGGATMDQLAKEYCGDESGRIADPGIRAEVAQHLMDQRCFATTVRRSVEEAKAGQGPGAASSMFKLYGTEMNKRRYELLVKILGAQALGWEGAGFSQRELATTREWLRSKGNSIEGGTSEVQLNIVAKRVLGLPD